VSLGFSPDAPTLVFMRHRVHARRRVGNGSENAEVFTPYKVDFEPVGRRGDCQPHQSLLECARQLSVDLVSICGGNGSCGRCKIQIITGVTSETTSAEEEVIAPDELAAGHRLACQAYPLSDVKAHVPPESLTAPQRTQIEGLEVHAEPDPAVRAYPLTLKPATLSDLSADDERITAALLRDHQIQIRHMDLEALRDLSPRLRNEGWQTRVAVRGDEVLAVCPISGSLLGLAVDIGTTKIAGYLVELASGQTLAAQGIMNPQIAYGEDIIARIGAAGRSPADALRLQQLLTEALNQLASGLCAQIGREPGEILDSVIVCNTAIHHLLLRLPVQQLAQAPYIPAVRGSVDVKARDLGLNLARGAYVHLLPNIAGYVGADHVAMLLAVDLSQAEGVALALDIGTNTEICLASGNNMTSASCASGPAFEGAHIKFGMRAAAGAIERVELSGDQVKYQTIGGVTPVGVCGSGLLDAVAHMHRQGVLDRGGRMGTHARVREIAGAPEFILVGEQERSGLPAITITQRDVRELQLAKGAIRTGIQVLLEARSHTERDIDRVIIAGAFGTYIDIASAIRIGMLPALPLSRFTQVGNAAGTGARLALISRSMRADAERIAVRDQYIELASTPGFDRKFAQAMYLGESLN
jgi:uncharacterized 2Fe-2S/4Fe-4S cluster protein (DUF4445 family)